MNHCWIDGMEQKLVSCVSRSDTFSLFCVFQILLSHHFNHWVPHSSDSWPRQLCRHSLRVQHLQLQDGVHPRHVYSIYFYRYLYIFFVLLFLNRWHRQAQLRPSVQCLPRNVTLAPTSCSQLRVARCDSAETNKLRIFGISPRNRLFCAQMPPVCLILLIAAKCDFYIKRLIW